MSDIASLLREAAEEIEMSRGYCDLADELRAAAESLGEPVVTIGADNDLVWASPYTFLAAGTKLYLAPQPAVPEGWKLVPVEPTDEMIDAGADAIDGYRVDVMRAYEAMIAEAGDK